MTSLAAEIKVEAFVSLERLRLCLVCFVSDRINSTSPNDPENQGHFKKVELDRIFNGFC